MKTFNYFSITMRAVVLVLGILLWQNKTYGQMILVDDDIGWITVGVDTDGDGVPDGGVGNLTCDSLIYPEFSYSGTCSSLSNLVKFFIVDIQTGQDIDSSNFLHLGNASGTIQLPIGDITNYYTPFILRQSGCYRLDCREYIQSAPPAIDTFMLPFLSTGSFCYIKDPNTDNITSSATVPCNSKTACFNTTYMPVNIDGQISSNPLDYFQSDQLIMLDALGNGYNGGIDDIIWCRRRVFGFNYSNQLCYTYTGAGPYNARIIYNNACGIRVDTVKVEFTSTPNVSISVQNTTLCQGSSTTLTATTNPTIAGTTYTWSSGQQGATIAVSPTATTTYTVTATANGCGATASAVVNILPADACCSNADSNLTASQRTILTFNNDITFTGLQNAISSAFPGNTYFTTSGGVTTFDNFPYDIVFNAKLIIDINAQIVRCQFLKFGKNGRVVQNNNTKLTTQSSVFTACGDYSWRGFTVNNTQKLFLESHTIIEYADTGVTAVNPDTLYAFYPEFIACHTGLHGLALIRNNTYLQGCHFRKDGLNLKIPYAGKNSRTGIELVYCYGIKINRCHVKDHNNGIILNGSDKVVIDKGLFENIQPFNNCVPINGQICKNESYLGKAIYGIGTNWFPTAPCYGPVSQTVQVGGSQFADKNTFNNCRYAVEFREFNCLVQNNQLTNCAFGYVIGNSVGKKMTIKSNKMQSVGYGIAALQNKSCTIAVDSNEIELLNPDVAGTISNGLSGNYYGITLNDWQGTPSSYSLSNNTIQNGLHGIRLLNLYGTQNKIEYNTVDQSQWVNSSNLSFNRKLQYGYYIDNCGNQTLSTNTYRAPISWNASDAVYNSRSSKAGMLIRNSSKNNIQCNLFEYAGYGIDVQGQNLGTNLLGNQFNFLQDGVYYQKFNDYGKLGDQKVIWGNYAFTNNNDFIPNTISRAHTFNYRPGANSTSSVPDDYYYSQGATWGYPLINLSNPVGSNNICKTRDYQSIGISTPNIFSINCGQIGSGQRVAGDGGEDAEKIGYMEDVAQEEINYPEFEETVKWLEERRLFRDIDEDTTLRDESIILEDFYDNLKNDAIGYLQAQKNGEKGLLDSMVIYNRDLYLQKLEALKLANEQILSVETREQNEKTINDIFYRTHAKGMDTMSDTERNFVAAMAYGCPLVDGEAVFLARAMQQLIDPAAFFDSKAICNSLGYYKKDNSEEEEEEASVWIADAHSQLLPNPANGYTLLSYQLSAEDRLSVKVYDMLGREVATQSSSTNVGTLYVDTHDWAEGNYIVKAVSREGKSLVHKLVVKH